MPSKGKGRLTRKRPSASDDGAKSKKAQGDGASSAKRRRNTSPARKVGAPSSRATRTTRSHATVSAAASPKSSVQVESDTKMKQAAPRTPRTTVTKLAATNQKSPSSKTSVRAKKAVTKKAAAKSVTKDAKTPKPTEKKKTTPKTSQLKKTAPKSAVKKKTTPKKAVGKKTTPSKIVKQNTASKAGKAVATKKAVTTKKQKGQSAAANKSAVSPQPQESGIVRKNMIDGNSTFSNNLTTLEDGTALYGDEYVKLCHDAFDFTTAIVLVSRYKDRLYVLRGTNDQIPGRDADRWFLNVVNLETEPRTARRLKIGNPEGYNCIAVSEKYIFTVDESEFLVFNRRTYKLIEEVPLDSLVKEQIFAMVCVPDGGLVVADPWGGEVKKILFDENWNVTAAWTVERKADVICYDAERNLIWIDDGGYLSLVDMNGKIVKEFNFPNEEVFCKAAEWSLPMITHMSMGIHKNIMYIKGPNEIVYCYDISNFQIDQPTEDGKAVAAKKAVTTKKQKGQSAAANKSAVSPQLQESGIVRKNMIDGDFRFGYNITTLEDGTVLYGDEYVKLCQDAFDFTTDSVMVSRYKDRLYVLRYTNDQIPGREARRWFFNVVNLETEPRTTRLFKHFGDPEMYCCIAVSEKYIFTVDESDFLVYDRRTYRCVEALEFSLFVKYQIFGMVCVPDGGLVVADPCGGEVKKILFDENWNVTEAWTVERTADLICYDAERNVIWIDDRGCLSLVDMNGKIVKEFNFPDEEVFCKAAERDMYMIMDMSTSIHKNMMYIKGPKNIVYCYDISNVKIDQPTEAGKAVAATKAVTTKTQKCQSAAANKSAVSPQPQESGIVRKKVINDVQHTTYNALFMKYNITTLEDGTVLFGNKYVKLYCDAFDPRTTYEIIVSRYENRLYVLRQNTDEPEDQEEFWFLDVCNLETEPITWRQVRDFGYGVYFVCIAVSERYIFTGGTGDLQVYDRSTYDLLATIHMYPFVTSELSEMVCVPDGGLVVTDSTNRKVKKILFDENWNLTVAWTVERATEDICYDSERNVIWVDDQDILSLLDMNGKTVKELISPWRSLHQEEVYRSDDGNRGMIIHKNMMYISANDTVYCYDISNIKID